VTGVATSDVLSRFRLDGRTAIVTGIGPGIGEHVAKAFAEVGARVVCAARTPDKVERVASEIVASGGQAVAVPTDVGRAADLERLVDAAHEAFGPVDVVFNNAHAGATAVDLDPWGIPDEVWTDAVAVNLMAPYRLARLVVPEMKAAGRGSIITLLTCAAFTPIPPQLAYGSTKSGLHMLTRYLAKVCGPEIRVNAICPGSMSPDGEVHENFAPHVAKNAISRTGWASEAVGAALLLASDASSYTTGSVIFCEGGRVGTIS
jgi:NAD(P)-dependent dehydrogenase (short-subunit alcohol dehydrogenase family)